MVYKFPPTKLVARSGYGLKGVMGYREYGIRGVLLYSGVKNRKKFRGPITDALDRGDDYYQAFEGFHIQYYGMWWWLFIVTVTRFQHIPLFHCLAIVLYLQLMIVDEKVGR